MEHHTSGRRKNAVPPDFAESRRTRVFNADYTFRPTEVQAENSGTTSDRPYADSHRPSALWGTLRGILIPINVFPIYKVLYHASAVFVKMIYNLLRGRR